MLPSFCSLNINTSRNLPCQIVPKHVVRGWANVRPRLREKIARNVQPPVSSNEPNPIPIIRCKRPQFNFYVGQKYRPYEQITLASKTWFHPKAKGDFIKISPAAYPITTDDKIRFSDLPLNKPIVTALREIGLETAMPIQAKAIPPIIEGLNTLIASETGCGKTLAFLLPMLHYIMHYKDVKQLDFNTPRGIIITPTRELAKQISLVVEHLGHYLDIKVKVISGGNLNDVLRNPPVNKIDILVSSIGALMKMSFYDVYKLDEVKHIVLDETDVLLSTFHDKVKMIVQKLPLHSERNKDKYGMPTNAQLTLTCATAPKNLEDSLRDIADVKNLVHISTERLHHIQVQQDFLRVLPSMKTMKLLEYVKERVRKNQRTIIFANNSKTCDFISIFLKKYNISTIGLHNDMQWQYRKTKLDEYLRGGSLILVATHIGARGIDTVIVKHILNYDFPLDTMEYIHRCGRTGRPGTNVNECKVTNLISTELQVKVTQKIELAIRKGMPIPIVNYRSKDINDEDGSLLNEENYLTDNIVYDNINDEESIPY